MPGRRFALFSLLLIALCSPSAAEEKPCTIHGNGKYYDLNPLRDSKDYELKTLGGLPLVLNVCGGLHRDLFGNHDDSPAGFVRRGHGDFSIGKDNQTLSLVASGPRLVLTDGTHCKTSSDETIQKIRASTVIDFVCDMAIFGSGTPRLIAQFPPIDENAACAFYFEWKTHYACPTSESTAWGFFSALAVVVLVVVMAYTIFGTLYNRFVLQLRGYDQIPQFSLESMKYHAHEAIDWFKDIMTIMYENSQRRGSDGGGLPFRRPGASSNSPNPFSHHTQANAGNEFTRPQGNRTESTTRRHNINPVSHQNQVQVESLSIGTPTQQQATPVPAPQQKDKHKAGDVLLKESPPQEKQEFMLDNDDDELEEEMDAMNSSSSQYVAAPATQVRRGGH